MGRVLDLWRRLGSRGRSLLVIGGAIAIVWLLFQFSHRDEPPFLSFSDVDSTGRAGSSELQSGTAYFRIAEADDYEAEVITPAFSYRSTDWMPFKKGNALLLGSLLYLDKKVYVQFITAGSWLIALDGEGDYIFEDAKRDQEGKKHTIFWNMKRGMFRAKVHDYDPTDHWLQLRTPFAYIFLRQGEMGLRIDNVKPPPGKRRGVLWHVKGRTIIKWNDGRRKVITEKGLYDL